ncbi:MAG TPA: hypothetical protein DCW73_10615 [Treponema sp.]|nr:hypothetical protein [Treponema sp.]
MYETGGTGVKKALCVIMKTLGFSENGFFTASFARIPALSPKTAEPFAAGLYGIVPHQGNLKISTESSKTVFKSVSHSSASF